MFTIPQKHIKPEAVDAAPSPHNTQYYPQPQWVNQQRYHQYPYLPQFQDSPRNDQPPRSEPRDYHSDARYAPRAIQDPRWQQQAYPPRWEQRWDQPRQPEDRKDLLYQQPTSPVRSQQQQYSYPVDGMGFPLMSGQNVDPFQNFMYSGGMQGFDPALMKNMMLAPETDLAARKRSGSELNNVLPVVMTGPRPYSPSTSHAAFSMKGGHGPLCCSQKIRVPSHLLLTSEQRTSMGDISVVKRVFDVDDVSTARIFLGQNGLLPEQLARPLNKWKTRNTRKRKHATTHLYQCCCGSDVKQFHGTKGTRRSKQKFPFVGCVAFVEVARRTEDGSLIWARGLMDHSPECQKAQPFVSQ